MKVLAIALALLDFAPLLLLSIGLVLLVRLAAKLDPRTFNMAFAGQLLICVAATARAVSNLLLAATGETVPILVPTLLVYAGPGLFLFVGALLRGFRTLIGRRSSLDHWAFPVTLSWAALGLAFYLHSQDREGDAWARMLLVIAWAGDVALCAVTAALGWLEDLHMAAGLLALHAFAITLLVGGSLLGLHGVWTQPVAGLLNLGAQMALLFAAWRIAAEYLAKP